MNLLFIDERIRGLEEFKNAINTNTKYIIYNVSNTFSEINSQIVNQTYSNIGFVFEDEQGHDTMFVEDKTFMSIETKTFISNLISSYSVQTIDFLACNLLKYTNWTQYFDYLMSNFNVVVRASDDRTGNLKSGGDWTLESTGADVSNLYFNSNLQYWNYTLDSSSAHFGVVTSDGYAIIQNTAISNANIPVYFKTLPYSENSMIIDISCGNFHTAIVTNNGKVMTIGNNSNGQLGNGTNTNSRVPTYVNLPPGVNAIKVSCGYLCTAVLTDDGKVLTFGQNNNGQLGDGTNISTNLPTYVILPSGVNAIEVSYGYSHTAVVTDDGKVLTFGYNANGQLGDGTTTNTSIPTYVNLPSGVNAIGVACGYLHTAVVTDNGNVLTFGYNQYGQLGNGTQGPTANTNIPTYVNLPSGVSAIGVASSFHYTVVVTDDGNVLTFGYNQYGQLGNGTQGSTANSNVPTYASMPNDVNAIGVSCGMYHTTVITDNGKALTFGYNNNGQLGNGTITIANIPTYVILPAGVNVVKAAKSVYNCYHTAILTDDGNALAMGQNIYKQLSNIFDKYSFSANALAIATGNNYTTVLLDDGKVLTFGSNNFGQLGNGTTTNTSIPTYAILPLGVNAVGVASGYDHTAVLTSDGNVLTFGSNNYGQLGDGTQGLTANTNIPTYAILPPSVNAIGVSCGGSHTAVVTDNGKVLTFGRNDVGQLGNGTITGSSIPTYINLPVGINAIGVSCGNLHTAVVTDNGKVLTFGSNNFGQLGNGTITNTSIPTYVNLPSGINAIYVSCGNSHTTVLTDNGNVLTFGQNNNGQLGDGTITNTSIPTYVMLNGVILSGAVQINCDSQTTKIVLNDGSVKIFGYI